MKVYSYLRFSAAKQASGTSLERQAEYARKWAESHGYTLDESLSMRDEGLSAYHQKHVKTGALGIFLEAVTAGKIPAGSVLIVEGLDRLSRAEPMLAQAQLTQIINAGLTVVTAADGKQYSRDSLRETPMDMIYSLLVMIRAHEESETKSKRISAACRRSCEAWVAGTFRGRVSGGRDPSWIKWVNGKSELRPDVAFAIKTVLDLYLKGFGPVKIIQEMNDRGLVVTCGQSVTNLDALITKSTHLFIGERRVKTHGQTYIMKDYYPPILTETEYARLLTTIANRKLSPRAAGGKSEFPSLFTGLGVAVCGYCKIPLVSNNQKRYRLDGSLMLYRRFKCTNCELKSIKKHNKKHHGSFPASGLERALLEFCSDQFNLTALLSGDDTTAALRAELAATEISLADLTRRQAKLMDTLLDDDGVPRIVMDKLRDTERKIDQANARIAQISAELHVVSSSSTSTSAALWQDIKQGVIDMDYNARLRCRQLIADTFQGVDVYFRGALPNVPENAIDIMLTSKTGVSRWLRVDRTTGEFIDGQERVIQPPAC